MRMQTKSEKRDGGFSVRFKLERQAVFRLYLNFQEKCYGKNIGTDKRKIKS